MRIVNFTLVICLLLAFVITFTGCSNGISQEQKEDYIRLATYWENKATEQQNIADEFWEKLPETLGNNEAFEIYLEICKHHDKLAEYYREHARHYRTLVTN